MLDYFLHALAILSADDSYFVSTRLTFTFVSVLELCKPGPYPTHFNNVAYDLGIERTSDKQFFANVDCVVSNCLAMYNTHYF